MYQYNYYAFLYFKNSNLPKIFIDTSNVIKAKEVFTKATINYVATQNCCVVANVTCEYGSSGYVELKLNGERLLRTTYQDRIYPFVLYLSKDDTLTIDANSTGDSFYTVYGLK